MREEVRFKQAALVDKWELRGKKLKNVYESGIVRTSGVSIIIVIFVIILWICSLILCWRTAQNQNQEVRQEALTIVAEEDNGTPITSGCSLDAIKFNAPAFSVGQYSYRVVDRTSGACWWLIRMADGDHVRWKVLPVNDGKSYVKEVK